MHAIYIEFQLIGWKTSSREKMMMAIEFVLKNYVGTDDMPLMEADTFSIERLPLIVQILRDVSQIQSAWSTLYMTC